MKGTPPFDIDEEKKLLEMIIQIFIDSGLLSHSDLIGEEIVNTPGIED